MPATITSRMREGVVGSRQPLGKNSDLDTDVDQGLSDLKLALQIPDGPFRDHLVLPLLGRQVGQVSL